MKCIKCLSIGGLIFSSTALALVANQLSEFPATRWTHVDHPSHSATTDAWKHDRAWHAGKAEWALYDAQRSIYGSSRKYEATIYTNKQLMDPSTTTKTDERHAGAFEVFKHTISEQIATEHYDYRFLTTAFLRTDNLAGYKLVASSQEDCGSSFREFVVQDERMTGMQSCYFPDTGRTSLDLEVQGQIAFHDALSLSLRDYPFGAVFVQQPTLNLVLSQRDNRQTSMEVVRATIHDLGIEKITVPYGTVRAHHLRIDHPEVGGVTESHYWFAEDADRMRHVMVQFQGPHGMRYQLKQVGWWAYWDRNEPRPE